MCKEAFEFSALFDWELRLLDVSLVDLFIWRVISCLQLGISNNYVILMNCCTNLSECAKFIC